MLKPYEMSKILVIGPKSMQENVISELHKLKILHIAEHSKNELADIGQPTESAGKLSEIMVKIRALINSLAIKKQEIAYEIPSVHEIESRANKISAVANEINDGLRGIEELRSKNLAMLNELKLLAGISLPLEAFEPFNSLAIFFLSAGLWNMSNFSVSFDNESFKYETS